jgi:hypothetical protein
MANCTNMVNNQTNNISMEEYLKQKQQIEDQIDYQFIQRIIQELTQSCALNLPIPASAIPQLIQQAAQFFWENSDQSIEERYYCLPNSEIKRCGPNNTVKLPEQIISVFGVYKTTEQYSFGNLGDFSLERIVMNNSAMAAGLGGNIQTAFGGGSGYNLTDVTAALYEVSTYQALFDAPLTFNFNEFSKELVILGALGNSDLVLQVFKRCKIQDLYKSYYFFRYCVCLGLRSMATIMGTFEYKLPGGVTLNYSVWREQAQSEMQEITEWINKNHSSDYFFMTNTI